MKDFRGARLTVSSQQADTDRAGSRTGTMNASSIRGCVKQAGLWCILVIAVVLLTLLFTVLGTITCAVLTGMMMAAARHQRWQTIPVSAVFPGVVIALIGLAKVDLEGQQRIVLPALCFGAFWFTYLVTRGIVRLETKPGGVSDTLIPAQPEKIVSEAVKELKLENLQGKWIFEGANGNVGRILEVAGDTFSLSEVDAGGRARLISKSNIKLELSQTPNRIVDTGADSVTQTR